MKKVILYYGPKNDFIRHLPRKQPVTTISELAICSDRKMREHVFKIQGRKNDASAMDEQKPQIPCLVGFSDQFAAISESAIQGFLSFIGQYEIDTLCLQNPPLQLVSQLQKSRAKIRVLRYVYSAVDERALREINATYEQRIVGQERALRRLLVTLYPLTRPECEKPVVLLFYGPTGVGKSETAIFLGEVMRQRVMRKQFSMYNSNEFAAYLFGGRHSQASFAKDLMERESNVLLFDEFDKANPLFHSAFYQLFDDGVYEDKSYRADVRRAVVVCTTNYTSEAEVRERLGAALLARFDAVIGFDPLSEGTITKILEREYDALIASLCDEERSCLSRLNMRSSLLRHVPKIGDSRQIKRIVRNAVSSALLDAVLGKSAEVKS